MQPSADNDHPSRYASPEQLRIGLYVYVDLPWFLHPFTLSRFRISSEEQIAQMRALKLERIRYDPDRSEDLPAELASAAPAEAAAATAATAAAEPADPAAPPAGEIEHSVATGDPAIAGKEARAQHLRARRRAVAQTEKAFVKATGIMHRLTWNVLQHPKETLQEIDGLVDQMATVFLERSEVCLHVMGEKCGGEEAYFHGLNVSILSMMLAKSLDLDADQARILGTGALLHDIGQINIPDRVLRKDPDAYTRPERELYASHVEYGVSIGKQLQLAPEALAIIAQHHEMADRSGYPRGIGLEAITPLARVVALANAYDKLCNPVMPNQAMTPHEALSFIFARRKDKFDVRVLQLLIRALGVYPPGSIVKLSDDSVAMVISVNPQKALRPWVLVYDAGVPKHEAPMLDLDREPGVSIAKTLRPALLPPAVYAYLSPRKRITYFFDSDPPKNGERA